MHSMSIVVYTQRAHHVETTSNQRLDVESTLNQRCFNGVCLLGIRFLTAVFYFKVNMVYIWYTCVFRLAGSFLVTRFRMTYGNSEDQDQSYVLC